MQPYLFPYLGYWQLINAVDTFVIYDNIQFNKRGWFHRNNILINGEKKLFTIPLKKDSNYLDVKDRYLSNDSSKNLKRILGQIKGSYSKAPYFNNVFPIVESIFLNEQKNLFNYIYYSITKIMQYLDINTKIVISSEIEMDHSLKSVERVISINKALGAKHYINPIGGFELYDKKQFENEGITLSFLESKVPEYKQFNHNFVPYLSIIDIMMFNSKIEIAQMLNEYEIK